MFLYDINIILDDKKLKIFKRKKKKKKELSIGGITIAKTFQNCNYLP